MNIHSNRLNLLLATLLAFTIIGCSPAVKEESHFVGRTMGTTYNVKYVPTPVAPQEEELKEEVDAALVRINALMSTYQDDSELSRFNQLQSGEDFKVDTETLLVLKEAKRLGHISDGYLDVTVGPLVNLWGFGPNARPEEVPSLEVIAQTKAKIGLRYLNLGDGAISKEHNELYVDLSTIAKGYGVDRVAAILESKGIDNYLVEIGGEMRLSGTKHDGVPWRIAIEKPVTEERAVQQLIEPGNNAVATSGDYRNYYEEQGIRYSHIIDPHTGKPIDHKLVSVTVIHPSSMTADGLSTAMMVMGLPRAMSFAQKYDIAALLLTKTEDGFKQQSTVKFKQFISKGMAK